MNRRPAQRPIRILHAFGRMGIGGAEMWAINALRNIDRERYHFHFLVHKTSPGELDDEIRSLGGTIHTAPHYRHPLRYPVEFGQVVRALRPDIVHSHVGFFSGWILSLARTMGIAGRIAHSHNDHLRGQRRTRQLYERTMRAALHGNATRGFGCSSRACAALYGLDWQTRGKYEVLLYGYDFARFANTSTTGEVGRASYREALGLADDDFVVGHIGRFVPQKNHDFIIDLAAASAHRGRNKDKFVLVGDGPDRPRIERTIAARGLRGKFVFTGQRSDIPALLSSFDVMILPSRWEGLGIVVLEAQAAGVKCILSDRVPHEATVITANVVQKPLDDVNAWLEAMDVLQTRAGLSGREAAMAMQQSGFAIEQHVARLAQIYAREAAQGRRFTGDGRADRQSARQAPRA